MINEEHIIQSASGEFSRKVWLLTASRGEPEKLAIFLDGEYYVNKMDAPAVLTSLQQTGIIPPMVCAFVSHVSGEARHHKRTGGKGAPKTLPGRVQFRGARNLDTIYPDALP
jgi:enterochelin esterase-like enzyme